MKFLSAHRDPQTKTLFGHIRNTIAALSAATSFGGCIEALTLRREVDEDGNVFWYNSDGKLHRDNDLPAAEYTNGTKSWRQHGIYYRKNGPTIVYSNGREAYCQYVNGSETWHTSPESMHAWLTKNSDWIYEIGVSL